MPNKNTALNTVPNNAKQILLVALYGVAFIAALAVLPAAAVAQQDNTITREILPDLQKEAEEKARKDEQLYLGLRESLLRNKKLKEPDLDPAAFNTLFFTLWQHALLQEAKKGFTARLPGDRELLDDNDDPLERIRGRREISLGGIVYATPHNWTVWLNGERVTPEAIPEEVLDIVVGKNYIKLKWFDSYTNLIYPVRLQAHQRFNLDTRIFLPGIGTL